MSRHFLVQVRHTPKHSVVAHCRSEFVPTGELRIRLLRVTPDHGTVPDVDHLRRRTFSDRVELRRAILEVMKEKTNVSNNHSTSGAA